ncbi:MAG: 4Fe-4S dicluster domain-containing protein [bacterium]
MRFKPLNPNPFTTNPVTILWLLPVLLSAGVVGAHFLRAGDPGLMAASWAVPLLLLIRRRWSARIVQGLLVAAAVFWLVLLSRLAGMRQEMGLAWGRLAAILIAVSLTAAGAALVFERQRLRELYRDTDVGAAASVAAFWITAVGLTVVQRVVSPPMLLAERFWQGGGWLTILALSTYAAWIAEQLLRPGQQARWRRRLWGLFSAVFFLQLLLGISGLERLLMSGALHLPVPAVIIGGPIYRGEGFFMPILFGVTVLLVGPAWCSYLCYIGAWDSALSRSKPPIQRTGRWHPWLRVFTLVVVAGVAFLLWALGASTTVAAACGIAFGFVGVLLMFLWSRRTGTMAHCSWYCPLGLLAGVFGRLSPHRLRLDNTCTSCGSCSRVCRYDALSEADIERRRPALSCTLCGDCVGVCKQSAIGYRLLGLSPTASRAVFIALVAGLHAVFLGVARL